MNEDSKIDLPIIQLISFDKLLRQYDVMAKSDNITAAKMAQRIIDAAKPYPELRAGFNDVTLLEKHKDVINIILQDIFSEVLTNNEIKAASLPYDNIIFNSSKRFKKILKDAGGDDFLPQMRNLPEHQMYIVACTVILNFHYGFNFDFKRPFFYDIPDKNGVMRHYRILYNADFMEILPTDKAKELTQKDVDELLDNFDNIDLWKEKIPPHSFVSKGFVISNMFDVTAEHSISEIKSSLIANDKRNSKNFMDNLQETFRSFFNTPNMKAGFVEYNAKDNRFERVYASGMESFLLRERDSVACASTLCQKSYHKLLEENSYFAISDVDRYYETADEMSLFKGLKEQGIKSAILAPIGQNGNLLGILELVAYEVNALNSVNANKLEDIMPFIVSAVLRSKIEESNLIDAVIQNECTSVHDSVYWRFEEEAKRFVKDSTEGRNPTFREIVFKDVYPLYGQVDIKNSSQARNIAIQRDLMIQLSTIGKVLEEAWQKTKLPIYEELMFRVNNHTDSIKDSLHTNSEQAIFNFVTEEINPVFSHLKKTDENLKNLILFYESSVDMGTESYYDHRRNYDESVTQINMKLAGLMDKKQKNAQAMFPHYFERYKTDGVEHNMYIGEEIVGDRDFDMLYLNNLRLWQLQVMCEMENAHYALKPKLPVPLDVASLILVYSTSLSIRFRMDEKRFDVDGTYNARYEIIKKRIDKSYIKGTNERLTQAGKMVIVYSQKKDELEYLRYITFLRSKGYFTGKVEIVELEGLQGVSGLKAIRADILYKTKQNNEEKTYTYEDLMNELKA
ncbi:GAF domain-containing protein [Zobellia sp. 1_MG-2023]|uniref:GAF domain-containing protein n=1 Tax=Zobellia sp. 1_MG-2023 TaxID=3062626 RepID=UPI00259A21C0|nr:GAF domain-containing protein [Zobellia sp. 1_MG-2023]MDO6817729.1 GAF domain-containing protein [Zobellia sp. 1_MG-2023]